MKKKIFFNVAVIVIAAVTIIACKKNINNFEDRSATATTTPFCVSCVSKGTVILSGVLSHNKTLFCDTTYILDGKYYVDSGVYLTIDPGTTIKAIKKSTPADASAIVVTRGGKIFANGTQTCPVAFTSNEASPAPGDWGGIVLLGNAPVNKVNPAIEGIDLPTVPANVDLRYGGTDPADNSGSLVYVRIEYAGQAIATDNELNGLTCGGVGNGTVLDFIQVYKGNDDAFEFFGGTVNAKHLYAYEPDDDAFDFDLGYVGSIQFAVSVLEDTAVYSANPNGIECDNDATGSADIPITRPMLSNLTIIGLSGSTAATGKGLLNGALFRRHSGGYRLFNSIIMGFPTGVNVSSGAANNIQYNIIHYFNACSNITLPPTNTCTNVSSTNANAYIKLKNPFIHPNPDFRPDTGSPALGYANFSLLPPGIFQPVTYAGAFGGGNLFGVNWVLGWTK